MVIARGALLLAWIGILLSGCGASSHPGLGGGAALTRSSTADLTGASDPVDFRIFVSEWGIMLGIDRTFSERRTFAEGTLVLNGESNPAGFWSRRFDDVVPAPQPFPVRAGEHVLVEAVVRPDCDAEPQTLPVFVLTSRTGLGVATTDSYRVSDPAAYRAALAEWCAMPPTIGLSGATFWPDGKFKVILSVFNPTSAPVTARSKAMTSNGTVWEAAATVVPPRSRGELTIRGTGDGCSAGSPWATGNVTVGGIAQQFTASESC